jgi:glucosamine--fructose-6-phosphate aminotransferase (isomerizing)
MCGIIGIVTSSVPAAPALLARLPNVAHRGYDSAGIAVMCPSGLIERFRRVGSPEALAENATAEGWSPTGTVGIAHTRWATHGPRTEENAHPHLSRDGNIAVVHNGTLTNDVELREKLATLGVHPASQTDSVLIAEYLERLLDAQADTDHLQVVRSVMELLEGTFALAILFAGDQSVYLACKDMPIGFCRFEDGFLIGSEPQALAGDGKEMAFLEDGSVLALSAEAARHGEHLLVAKNGASRRTASIPEPSAKTPSPFATWMEREIHEQPQAIAGSVEGATSRGGFSEMIANQDASVSDRLSEVGCHVALVGCGSSFHAGQFAAAAGRGYARRTSAHLAGDMDWNEIPTDAIVVAISQSGETYDLLEELRRGADGRKIVALVNDGGSSLARMAHVRLPLGVGRERSVASTKAFLAQAVLGTLLTDAAESTTNTLDHVFGTRDFLESVLDACREPSRTAARRLAQAQSAYVLGTGILAPIAREGALKIKEVSGLHAEATSTGELKHGPLALVGPPVPTVLLLPHITETALLERAGLALLEIQNRGGDTIVIGSERSVAAIQDRKPTFTVALPNKAPVATALATVVPLQLMALFAAEILGRDVDRPRNLAKTVTVP